MIGARKLSRLFLGSLGCIRISGTRKGETMSDFEYKRWRIELRSSKAPDADGWRAYVIVSADQGGSLRTVPLSYKDARLFPTKEAADQAGVRIAKTWINHRA